MIHFKYTMSKRYFLSLLFLASQTFSACTSSVNPKSDEDADLVVRKDAKITNLNRANGEEIIKNIADAPFSKQIFSYFPAQNWKDKGFKTLQGNLLKTLLRTEQATPFTLQADNHILSLKEMYQTQEDWQEKRSVGTFAVYSSNLKDAYVFISEGKIKRHDESNTEILHYSFWHYNGKEWKDISDKVQLPKLENIFDKGDMANLFLDKSEQFVLKPSLTYPEYIICSLPPLAVSTLKMDKDYYLKWIGNSFLLEDASNLAISR